MRFGYLFAIVMLLVALLGLQPSPCSAATPVTSIIDAKLAADTTPVSLTGAIVTAAATDLFYIEADNRSSGICVQIPAHTLRSGKRANITGTMQTDSDGERYIAAATATENGTGSVRPIALRNKDLGGSALLSETAGGGQIGVPGGVGLNNIGLLVYTRGRVTYGGNGFFYIDDGSGSLDGSGYTGVKIIGSMPLCDGMDPVGWYVQVAGLSSISRAGEGICPCILSTGVWLLNQVQTPSGLIYADLKNGTGATAGVGSAVSVHYQLWLTSCDKADSSVDRGEPFEFTVGIGDVVPGFDEGVMGMKVGGKRFLVIPPELGYGEAGAGWAIPPNSTLLFEIELLSCVDAE